MASEEERAKTAPHKGPADELERALAELQQANQQLVMAGVRFQEMVEQAERARGDAERERLKAEMARSHAEAANLAKDEFLAAVSHELRTPLNAILGWTKMLRERTLKGEAVDKALETIERNARQQFQVVADLLQVSEMITGRFELDARPMALGPLVAASVDALQPAAIAKEIDLESQIESVDPILGDHNRLQQVLWNLLSNALKFTPRRGQVHVALTEAESFVQLSVRDSGVGIAPEFLPYVFDRYRQEESSYGRSFGGLGLGLAIVRQIVELHGGTVKVDSAGKGLGSTFSVEFPALMSEPELESREAGPSGRRPLSTYALKE